MALDYKFKAINCKRKGRLGNEKKKNCKKNNNNKHGIAWANTVSGNGFCRR